jgi:hypothetical protein
LKGLSMGSAAAAKRRRQITPINDFANISSVRQPTGRLNTLRLQYHLKKYGLLPMLIQGAKLSGAMFLVLGALLAVLNFRIVHDGHGNFRIDSKPCWSFAGTFITESETGHRTALFSGSAQSLVRQQPDTGRFQDTLQMRTTENKMTAFTEAGSVQEQGQVIDPRITRCRKNCELLTKAIRNYDSAHSTAPMKSLEMFKLIADGYISEIIDCPLGGEYYIKEDAKTGKHIICCSHKLLSGE